MTGLNAEQTLTKDTVPINVDAIIFWCVHDAQRATPTIADYRRAIDRVIQTSLREMIGASMLSTLLSDRKTTGERLRAEVGEKTAAWGVTVSSVGVRDVATPVALQDAMPRQAQAEREKQAHVTLGPAETAIAAKFIETVGMYEDHPRAPQLRAMSIIYEIIKEHGATVLMLTSTVDNINPVAMVFGASGCTEQISTVLPFKMTAAATAT